MKAEVVNKNGDSAFNGPYAGRDLYIIMFQDNEREYVVTRKVNITPVSYFTGRETELRELSQMIESGRKLVLVSGMGGIGKTHICRKLFGKYLDEHTSRFRHIGYIEYNGDMDSSLQNCLKFKKQDNPEYNQEAAWRELEYLASDGKLLLFIDNVDKSIGDDKSLQRLTSIPGAIILTSRQVSLGDEFELYPIDFLDMEHCKEIYEKIRFSGSRKKVKSEETQDLEYVIEDLAGRHTITVEFLAHLARTNLWSVKRLREELEQKGFCLEFHKNKKLVNIQKSYEALYDLSKLSESEQNILEAFSVFPYIPLEADICNQWLLADAGVSEKANILMELYEKGWLQLDIEQEGYSMHPVFAQFIYEKCRPNAERHMGLIEACESSLEIPDSGYILECQKYIPFAKNIVEKINMDESLRQIEFISSIAYLLVHIGDYKKAERLYKKSLRIMEKVLGEETSDTATSYNNLAGVYAQQGKYAEAEELYKKSLRIREKVLGEENPDTATSYNNLAGVYADQGKYAEAEELYKKSLRIREKVLGEENPDTATSYNNLAGVYADQGKYAEAEELYKKSLRIREKVLGEEHPNTATSYNNLAGVYADQGKYAEAEELYKNSLRISEKVLGEEHPNTATSYSNLAGVYADQGKYAEAEELYKNSLRISEKVLGEEHPDTAISYNNLACLYLTQEKNVKIVFKYYLKAYKIFLCKLGFNHPYTKSVLEDLQFAYTEYYPNGNFEQWLEEKLKE